MTPIHFIAAFLFLALVSASAFAADKPSGGSTAASGSRLSCFSITPPHDRKASCDRLCAAKEAACVGMVTNGAMNPGVGCGDASDPKLIGDYVASCRCCAVEQR
jgi:hypothetical protein